MICLQATKVAYCDRVGSVYIASIGNVCNEVAPLSQCLEVAACAIAILTHLQHDKTYLDCSVHQR